MKLSEINDILISSTVSCRTVGKFSVITHYGKPVMLIKTDEVVVSLAPTEAEGYKGFEELRWGKSTNRLLALLGKYSAILGRKVNVVSRKAFDTTLKQIEV